MARKMKLDFSGVESFQRASEGIHVCKIVSADMKQSSGGNDMIVVAFEVTKGDDKGSRVYENYPLVDNALWKLKGMLQAIGIKADGKVQLDLDKLIGKVLQINVQHEEYEGKIRARVESTMKFSAGNSDVEDEDEDEDDLSADTEDDDEEEEKPAKKSKKKAPMNKPEPADDDDDWDEEDEEEEPAPKKKSAKKEAPAKKTSKKSKKEEPEEDDDWDDDDDWDEEDA